jgi:hypothetical protein
MPAFVGIPYAGFGIKAVSGARTGLSRLPEVVFVTRQERPGCQREGLVAVGFHTPANPSMASIIVRLKSATAIELLRILPICAL